MSVTRSRAILALVCLVACTPASQDAASGDEGGTLVIAAPTDPRTLLPLFAGGVAEKQVIDQVFDVLAEIPADLNTLGDKGWTPRLASSWSWSTDSLSITFRLNPGARWHDDLPVRASDVAFSLSLYRDPAVGAYDAPNLRNVDSITVIDSLTFVAWFHQRSPEQFFKLAYYLQVLPEHVLRDIPRAELASSPFARAPIGSGPFAFRSWEPRKSLELVANVAYHRGRPRLDRLIWTTEPEAVTAVTKVLAAEADVRENVPPDAAPRVAASSTARLVPYRMLNYGFVVFNQRARGDDARPHPLFSSRELRRALSMALDRESMVRNVLDTLGQAALGPFSSGIPTADSSLQGLRYDPAAAIALLDSLGWHDTDNDGIRERNGVPLRFSLAVPVTSPPRRRFAVLMQEQWRRVGVQVDIDEGDPARLFPDVFSGRFDVFINYMQTSPAPSSIAEAWANPAPERRQHNAGLYGNPRVDALVDSALMEFDPVRRRELYRRAYRLVVDDAPAVWLYELRSVAAIHTRVRPVIDQADMWWRDLRLWWVPDSERLPRDRLGLEVTRN